MKIGSFKFDNTANTANIDRKAVTKAFEGFGTPIDRIEMRYNVRSGTPAYAAARSLHQWRSVLGHKLGGLMRQAVVKLAEIKRPFINAHNYLRHAKDGTLSEYTKLQSNRDVLKACQQMSNRKPAEMMKYMSFQQFPERLHKEAGSYDTSLGTHLLGKRLAREKTDEMRTFLKAQNWPDQKIETTLDSLKYKSPLEEKRERNAEMRHQRAVDRAERKEQFFIDVKEQGFKVAYRNLKERAHRDEERFQHKFNGIEPSWYKDSEVRLDIRGGETGKIDSPRPERRDSTVMIEIEMDGTPIRDQRRNSDPNSIPQLSESGTIDIDDK